MNAPAPLHVLCLAKTPRPTFLQDMTPEEADTMRRHGMWLKGLLEQGRLLLAGPCLDNSYGVAIFKAASVDEVRALLEEDPAKTLFAGYELHPMRVGMLRAE
jgi:uncharacterized protein YciI